MAKGVKTTEQTKKDVFEMLDAGMTVREIADLVNLSQDTVYRYRKNWKKRQSKNEPEVVEETETKTEVSTGLADSDYAKAYLENDPAVVRSAFDISRTVRIRSKKTGIMYEMDNGLDAKILKITLADGQTIDIELGVFEKFCDEGIDVFLELKRTA